MRIRSTPEGRLESWRKVQESGHPVWLAESAPAIIAELEAEIAAKKRRQDGQVA